MVEEPRLWGSQGMCLALPWFGALPGTAFVDCSFCLNFFIIFVERRILTPGISHWCAFTPPITSLSACSDAEVLNSTQPGLHPWSLGIWHWSCPGWSLNWGAASAPGSSELQALESLKAQGIQENPLLCSAGVPPFNWGEIRCSLKSRSEILSGILGRLMTFTTRVILA